MINELFSWVKNIAYYMILITAIVQVLPNNSYQKYIRFFTGIVLILLISTPILKLFGIYQDEKSILNMELYQEKLEEIEKNIVLQEEKSEEINIERIQIGGADEEIRIP